MTHYIIAPPNQHIHTALEKITATIRGISFEIETPENIGEPTHAKATPDDKLLHSPILQAMLKRKAHIAVLTAADLPYPLPQGIELVALLNNSHTAPAEARHKITKAQAYNLHNQLAILIHPEKTYLKELFAPFDTRKQFGKVSMVGAGAGEADLITVRGQNLLSVADVVLYDELIDKKILNLISGKKVFVGKHKHFEAKTQDETHEFMYRYALRGYHVVRLKGGDPMIFGHGSEEVAYLEKRFIPVEVVPGITTALSAAARLRTSLTLKNLASSVAYCTGYPKKSIQFPSADTLVYYMCSTHLQYICQRLIDLGRHQNTTVVLAHNLGYPGESLQFSTLKETAHLQDKLPTPLVAIISNALDRNQWHIATRQQKKALFTGLTLPKETGEHKIIHRPFIEIKELDDYTELDTTINNLALYQWIVFTSRYAVAYFFKRLYALHIDSRQLAHLMIASIGNTTSAKLKEYGIIPNLQAADESSEGIVTEFKNRGISNTRILIPRSNAGLPLLPDGLQKLGNQIDIAVVYLNLPKKVKLSIKPNQYDEIIFSSPSGVRSFFRQIPAEDLQARFVCKGKQTQQELNKFISADPTG